MATNRKTSIWWTVGGIVILLWALFPEGGNDRFTATAFWPMLAISAAGEIGRAHV